jgi:hypothetical protein
MSNVQLPSNISKVAQRDILDLEKRIQSFKAGEKCNGN